MLAWKYKTLSHEIPMVIDGQPISEKYVKRQKVVYWILMAANILLPALFPLVLMQINREIYINIRSPSHYQQTVFNTVAISIGAL
jgi:hypothetical protein